MQFGSPAAEISVCRNPSQRDSLATTFSEPLPNSIQAPNTPSASRQATIWCTTANVPPKAVIGLACRYSVGRVLEPQEFSGGEAPGQANFVLRELGFTVVSKAEGDAVEDNLAVEEERKHRLGLWESLKEKGGPLGVAPGVLRDLGIYGGAQGIWVDKARTGQITKDGEGITVAVLHTGSSYADDLADDCVIYHYPQTRRPASRDQAEVDATKAAGSPPSSVFRHRLPDTEFKRT